jgi:hypothetical protein
MSIDYLPDEMNYERSNLCWNEPATADAFNDGWRAACEAWQTSGKWAKVPVVHDVGEFYQAPQPAPDWRAACVVVKRRCCGWDITHNGHHYHPGIEFRRWLKPMHEPTCGMYGSQEIARAALAACPTPPPDAAEAARGT